MKTLIILLITAISVSEGIANYAIIAQNHDARSKIDKKYYLAFVKQRKLDRVWHIAFFLMWVFIVSIILVNDIANWWQVVLMGMLRLTVFPTVINYLTTKNLFPRRLEYLSDNGIDGIVKRIFGETFIFYAKWILLLEFIGYILIHHP
jgi:hypothetical protein